MGVLACDRRGCGNVMCNRSGYSSGKTYYICWECFDELVATGPTTDIGVFMGSDKPDGDNGDNGAFARYNDVFPLGE